MVKIEYVEHEDFYEMIVHNMKKQIVAKTIFDKDDYEKISKYRWHFTMGYVKCSRPSIFLHTLILGKIEGMMVDHVNRNRLDNRKANLRHTTATVNGWNKGKQSNNTSGHVGVSWDKSRNKWESHIKLNGVKKFLGYSVLLEDAVAIRKKAEVLYFGEEINRHNDEHTVFKKKNKSLKHQPPQN
jgi:hypothetical protein